MKKVLSNAAIGRFIREKRVELNYTQDELADKMKVTKTAVSNWENGNAIVDVKYLVRLSNLFSVTVDEILFPNATSERSREYSDVSRQFENMLAFQIEDEHLCIKAVEGGKRCPACGNFMTIRESKIDGNKFWGCTSYPRCTHTEQIISNKVTVYRPRQ